MCGVVCIYGVFCVCDVCICVHMFVWGYVWWGVYVCIGLEYLLVVKSIEELDRHLIGN